MSPEPAARRLFFALWPDPATRAAVASSSAPVLAASGGRAVPPQNLHVTLAFLGAVPAARVAEVDAVARGLVVPAPFELLLDHVQAWGRAGPLVLVPRASPPLVGLQAVLAAGLAAAGFALEPRPFRPHVTLARRPAGRPAAASAIGPVRWPVTGFALVESTVGADGSVYAVLERYEPG